MKASDEKNDGQLATLTAQMEKMYVMLKELHNGIPKGKLSGICIRHKGSYAITVRGTDFIGGVT